MAKKRLLLLTVHGMGETKANYWQGLVHSLANSIKPALWEQIHFMPIYY
jgi:hypothetical protein